MSRKHDRTMMVNEKVKEILEDPMTLFYLGGKLIRRKPKYMPLAFIDVANGLPPNLLMNVLPSAAETKFSFVAPTKRPRLIHLSIRNAGEVPFTIGGSKRNAIDYVVHVELRGVAGVVAPIVGKEPLDYHIWILPGAAPAFIREEGQLYEGGPVWRIEQISPTFAK